MNKGYTLVNLMTGSVVGVIFSVAVIMVVSLVIQIIATIATPNMIENKIESGLTKKTYLTLLSDTGEHIEHIVAIGPIKTGLSGQITYSDWDREYTFNGKYFSNTIGFKCDHNE